MKGLGSMYKVNSLNFIITDAPKNTHTHIYNFYYVLKE